MKITVAAFAAAILTTASLITYTDGSTSSAIASPAGLGGGSNVGHNTPSHPSAFGRGFATGLLASGPIGGDGGLTMGDRWGPHYTVAFGNPTRGWGPYEVNRKPGGYPTVANVNPGGQPIACPCVVAYDPFNKRVNGGVDVPEARRLAIAVSDGVAYDKYGDIGATMALEVSGALMSAVWGPHFDPTPRYHSGSK
jgi:hypothetical protein